MNKVKKYTLFGVLVLLAVFLRVYHLTSLPLEMHIDEAGLGLNAWSIANFHTDRYGNFLPVCPSNFYGEQSAFYTYFCAVLVKLFGLNLYTLRLPGAVMGIVTVIFGALLMKEKWGDRGMYTGLVLLTICPYFIMNSRFALDCNAMLGTVTIALYSLIRLLKRIKEHPERKWYGYFVLTGLLFGIVLYTYIIAAVAVAAFCVFFGIYYLFYQKENQSLRFRQLLFLGLPLVVMVIPLILVVCVNYFNWEPISLPFFSIPKMAVNRTQEFGLTFSNLPQKLLALRYLLTSDGKYGASDHYWTMYLWSVPMIAAGVFFSFKDVLHSCRIRELGMDICVWFLGISEVILFLLCGQYNYHINGIFIVLAYFCVNGILSTLAYLKNPRMRLVYAGILVCAYGVSFLGFGREYFGNVPTEAYRVYGGVDEALSLLKDTQKEGEIYVLDEVGEFYFLSNPVSSFEFSAACNELGYIEDYGNLHFYEPKVYLETDVYVCNKSSGRYYFFSDPELLGHDCHVLETEYYYVFYPDQDKS